MSVRNTIKNCSGQAIAKAFDRLSKRHIPKDKWIGSSNIYRANAIKKLNKTTHAIKPNQISEYVASSVCLHCYDGWNFLSRAVESLINGDISSAIHFAYYSELRSVMSMMAFEGLGIFDKRHIWFDKSSTPNILNVRGTHKVADEGITEWSKLARKKDSVFKLIIANNRNLGDWIDASGVSSSGGYASSVVGKWLQNWSMDVQLEKDQRLRNEMSYRPHFDVKQVSTKEALEKVRQLWEVLEPGENNRFQLLDQHLFRKAMEEIYAISGKSSGGVSYKKFVEDTFDSLGEDKSKLLFQFLLRNHLPDDHFILTEARKDKGSKRINLDDPFPMICRAILLLRFASGFSSRLISDASFGEDTLKFWWEELALNIGIIDTRPSGIQVTDLYTDITESIAEIDFPGFPVSLREALKLYSVQFNVLKQFQRVGIWSIAI